jgi:Domain of unknown function (DUF4148)
MTALKTTSLLVAALCSAYVTAASAADADPPFVPTSQLTRAEVLADLEAWQRAGMPTFTRGDADAAFVPTSALTRAEVLADLEVWQLAGMPAFHRGDADTDLNSAGYRVAQAKYQQMIESPEFAQRVIRIARQRGERVDVAAN